MGNKRTIEKLNQLLDEIPDLKQKGGGSREYRLWYDKTRDTLESLFGRDSVEYRRFTEKIRSYNRGASEAEKRERYLKHLEEHETDLTSIIHRQGIKRTLDRTRETINKEALLKRQLSESGIRKQLSGTPVELAPHIVRVANEFQFQGLNYHAQEASKSNQFSKQFRIMCGKDFGPRIITIGGEAPKDLPNDVGIITLQPLPNNKTIFIGEHISSSFDSEGSYFDSFLERLSLEFKNLGIEETTVKKMEQKDTAKSPIQLFDAMQFHPRIRRVSKSLFNSGHYAEAIFAAFKAVNNFTKKKTGLSIDGKDLMAKAFNEDKPIIKLNKLSNQSERDEQEGFRFLFMGAMVGIRNPKAHEDIRQIDPYKALEYLSFASLLMRRVIEGKLEIEEQT